MSNEPHITCIKTSFSDIFKQNPLYHTRLILYLQQYQALGDHATHCLKFFIVNSPTIPIITQKHVEAILYLVNKGRQWCPKDRDKQELKNLLWPFVEEYLLLLNADYVGMEHDQQPINFLSQTIFTNLKVNVQEHFVQMVNRYINHRVGKCLIQRSLQ